MQRATGINENSILFSLPNILPYTSFPIDIMHLFYNIGKDMIRLWLTPGKPYSLTKLSVKEIDEELMRFGGGVPSQMASHPRPLSWRMFVELVDICWLPTLKKRDVERLQHLALGFYRHVEQQYFREDPERIQLCNYTIHLLLHLAEGVFESGPPVGYSQYWMERYIGWVLGRMNAINLAAASLMNDAKFVEANKSFFRVSVENDGMKMIRDLNERGGYELRGQKQTYWVGSNEDMDEQLSSCLRGYFMRKYDGLASSKVIDIRDAIDHVHFRPRLRFSCGSALQDTMARVRPGTLDFFERRSRVNWHNAAEMEDGNRVEV
ncbi:hypothetical protein BWQ96_08423 [Gracilariopsis chorda]|uniref:Uncharacterized protein n=1 Tax=Gracilariopsis chorda TaxID=448386 RepID=A0A2V3IIC6_9FLOR|nr:hypothetical protein BWQ96_08423 [Gracilariopsis chorda]|eukprot:PXF41844.1 hypothetical protein BWQ96_08423 [Gracilariopsis chorda]